MAEFKFDILAREENSRARAGVIRTRHGYIETPYLIPVATRGEIISLSPSDVEMLGVQCLLANTYHLHLKCDSGKIREGGGLHQFMKFSKPLFTDSGGFQAFSLGLGRASNIRKIGFFPHERNSFARGNDYAEVVEEGVKFKSVYNGTEHFIDAKKSMQIQRDLGADIIMAFDECTSPFNDKEYIRASMERSHRWEAESLKYHDKRQALYGIIHGGWFKDLRLESARFVTSLPFEGIAIGGSLGKTKEKMYEILDWLAPEIDNRPRHMLGIGWIDDVFECVERGIDTFECVEMTRIARHGNLYIGVNSGGSKGNKFRIDIAKAIHAEDNNPIDSTCDCFTCGSYSRMRLREMFKKKSTEYARLATIHNIHFMLSLMGDIRNSIKAGRFSELKKKWGC